MRFSVVTVCFNSSATIVETLHSVREQRGVEVEHIVIDGGSTDGTQELVRMHGAHVARFVSEPDRGIYDAMNKGVALATGAAVGFLNSDDVFAVDTALSCIAQALSPADVDAAYGDLVFVDPRNTARVVRYWRPGPYATGQCRRGWIPPHPTLYVRREILQAYPFDLEFCLQADFELILRLFEVVGINARYIPETLVRFRTGGASTGSLRNIIRGNLEASRACRKNGFRGGPWFILSKIAHRLPQLIARPRGIS